MKYYSLFLLVLSLSGHINSDAVCDLATLRLELKQDLADNGMLDCLRHIDPPHSIVETEEQTYLRLAAQWDTACSFEGPEFEAQLKSYLGIDTLVDSVGEPVSDDFDDQADMCEIVRAALHKNLFGLENVNMQKIPESILDSLDCAGAPSLTDAGPRICAANGDSFYAKESWIIFLAPSYIKIGDKPSFAKVEIDTTSSYSNGIASLASELLQKVIDPDLLLEGENLLKKELESGGPDDDSHTLKDTGVTGHTDLNPHVHLLSRDDVTFENRNSGKKFILIPGATQKFKLGGKRMIFSFYMTSFKLSDNKSGDASFKLVFNNSEKRESKQSVENVTQHALVSAYVEEHISNKPTEDVELKLYGDSKGKITFDQSDGDLNLTFGAITMPHGEFYKHINTSSLEIKKTSSTAFNTFPGLELNIVNTKAQKKGRIFLIFFNLVLPLKGGDETKFIARLNTNGEELKYSTATAGPLTRISLHSAFAMKIDKDTKITLDYKSTVDINLYITKEDSLHYDQSISAIQLPVTAELSSSYLRSKISLNQGDWKSLGLKHNIKVNKKRSALILYNINVAISNDKEKLSSTYLSCRLRINQKFSTRSVLTTSGEYFAHLQGYVIRVLHEGEYNFDLEIKSNSSSQFDPMNEALTGEHIFLQVILLD